MIACIIILAATLTSQVGSIPTRSLAGARVSSKYVLGPSGGTPNATISILPKTTVDLSRGMKQIRIGVYLNNTPDVPPFNSINVQLSYDTHVLSTLDDQASSTSNLDYSTNVFSQSSYQQVIGFDCLDGRGANGHLGACGVNDRPGYVTFAETLLGGATLDGTEGNIFFLTFNVNTTAPPSITQIQIVHGAPGYGSQEIPATLVDGYYSTLGCGILSCQPAVSKFTWSPQPAKQGLITIFYGNASLPSTGGSITDYYWTFGDTSGQTPYRDTGANYTVSYIYSVARNYTVTLRITDSLGVKASTSLIVRVINTQVDMGIDDVKINPNPAGQYAGVVFTITAIIKNHGGLPENTNLTIALYGQAKPLKFLNTTFFAPQAEMTVTATWDSKGQLPNVYRIDAFTPILKNESITDHNPNFVSSWIQLVGVQPSGSLSLLSTAGISVLVVGAGSIGVSFLRKRNRNLDDAL